MQIALTLGDPNGVGPEVVLKALADARLQRRADFLLIGSAPALEHYARKLGLVEVLKDLRVEDVTPEGFDVEEGVVTAWAGEAAMRGVARACDLCLEGAVSGMVTAPIHKEAINLAGHAFPGHTEFLARRTGTRDYVMMMASGPLRVALVTTHIPLKDVAGLVTVTAVHRTLERVAAGLRQDFGIETPRLALLGLNPHAGDGGVLGTEELDTLVPAMALARQNGLSVDGPYPADGFFGRRAHEHFDAVIACYHDQGLVPFKTIAMGGGVNVTLGLPIVRTSPDHGTAFDIAGKGLADPSSFIEAANLAVQIAARRAG